MIMKTRIPHLVFALALLVFSSFNSQLSTAFAQGTAFSYQGRLNVNASPANGLYDFRFKLYFDPLGNVQAGSSYVTNAVPTTNGLFMVVLDFGPGIFTGSNYWLEVDVKTNNAGTYMVLNPFQAVTPAPYAIFANTASNLIGTLSAAQLNGPVPSASLAGTYGGVITLNNVANSFTGNGSGLTGVSALTLDGLGPNNFWQTTGNAGTTAGVNFVGTVDSQALELHVDGQRAFRLEPGLFGSITIPNVIGGSLGNYVVPGTLGATIGGGGTTDSADPNDTNVVSGNFSTIAGGVGNMILNNTYEGSIGGGYKNSITNDAAWATISGGYQNTVSGSAGTIPGGENNIAAGADSFAAGDNAQAMNSGSFVWADGSGGAFADTAPNQFLIRATGGVGIGTTTPASKLEVNGDVRVDSNRLLLNSGSDTNSGLVYVPYPSGLLGNFVGDGPCLFGYNGGALGAVAPTVITLSWDYLGNVWVSNNLSSISMNVDRGGLNTGTVHSNALTFGVSSGEGIASKRSSGGTQYDLEFYTSFNNRMIILNNGDVGIGTAGPDALLTVNGTADKPGGGSWSTFSDGRLKDVGVKFTDGLEALDEIQPVHYHYKADNPLNLPSQPEYVGVVAQQVQDAVPEAVQRNKDGYLVVNNDPIIWTMLNAIKELNQKRETEAMEKDAEIQTLKRQNDSLAERLNKLEAAVKQLTTQN
jgi:hypothetical protein